MWKNRYGGYIMVVNGYEWNMNELPSCSFFPLLLYSACIYSSLFFSTPFSPLPSPSFWFFPFLFSTLFMLSALARSLTVMVDIGSLDKELNLQLILFILALIPPTLSVGLGSLEKDIKSWVNSVHIGSDTSCSFFPLLLYSDCIDSSLLFSTFVSLLYLLHPSDSFPFSSLLFSCSLFKCTCPKFNCKGCNALWRRDRFSSWTTSSSRQEGSCRPALRAPLCGEPLPPQPSSEAKTSMSGNQMTWRKWTRDFPMKRS